METFEDDYHVIEDVNFSDFNLHHPFRLIISGPSNSGKTQFTFSIIKNIENVITPPISKVIYLYGEYQEIFNQWKTNVHFTQDLTLLDSHHNEPTLIVIDDLAKELQNNDDLVKLFYKWSHHRKISVILILQNIFGASKYFKDIRLNATNYFFTKHLTDLNQLEILGRQIEGVGCSNIFMEAYHAANANKFNGLFVDLHPESDTKDVYKYRYFQNNDIMKPIFLLNEKNCEFHK